MSLLIAQVQTKSRINAVKRLLEIYLLLNQIQYQDAHLTVLAYYCLLGTDRRVNLQIIRDYYAHLPRKNGESVIYRIRHQLKRKGLLLQDPYDLTLSVLPEIQDVFSDMSRLGAMIKFSYEDEAAP